MSAPVKHTAFDTSHPLVAAVYLALTLVMTMSSLQPVLILISLLGALACGCCLRGAAATAAGLRWQLPIIAIIALLNPIFSASGATELFRIGVRAVYLESVCYGVAMGALLVASMTWLQVASELLPFDKVMTLFGNVAPVIALMLSMTMRLVPRFLRKGRMVSAVHGSITLSDRRALDEVRGRMRLSSILMGWGMEDSLETADAMRARGWGGAPRRTTYTRHRLSSLDVLATGLLIAFGAMVAALAFVATSQFGFFPRMSQLVPWWGYIPYAAWMAVPVVLHIQVGRSLT
ncbi:MAG: energy-coupling factor transporter transmembrane component T [Collinsella sp.]|nr:energy-coupling factor transporter transmembrane component T [Collinsella sp.]